MKDFKIKFKIMFDYFFKEEKINNSLGFSIFFIFKYF